MGSGSAKKIRAAGRGLAASSRVERLVQAGTNRSNTGTEVVLRLSILVSDET